VLPSETRLLPTIATTFRRWQRGWTCHPCFDEWPTPRCRPIPYAEHEEQDLIRTSPTPSKAHHMKHAIIIGAQKAGTTFLHNALATDPVVCTRPEKEPHYFSSSRFEDTPYASIFPGQTGASVLLDSSASYLHSSETARKISEAGIDPLVLVLVRDPLRRAVSGFLHNAKNGRDTRSAARALGLDSTVWPDIFEEETANIEKALSRGQIVLRPEYHSHFGDLRYSDPLWSFRYVSNSFYASQAFVFEQTFDRFEVVEFERLIRDPLRIVNVIRGILELPPLEDLPNKLGRNETKISKIKVARKFLRNCAYETGQTPGGGRVLLSVASALSNTYDAKALASAMAKLPWVAPARATFEAMRARALS
jgi:hypothetical protein